MKKNYAGILMQDTDAWAQGGRDGYFENMEPIGLSDGLAVGDERTKDAFRGFGRSNWKGWCFHHLSREMSGGKIKSLVLTRLSLSFLSLTHPPGGGKEAGRSRSLEFGREV